MNSKSITLMKKLCQLSVLCICSSLFFQSPGVQASPAQPVGQLFNGSSVAGDTSFEFDDFDNYGLVGGGSYYSDDDEWLLTLTEPGNFIIDLHPVEGHDLALFLLADMNDETSLIEYSDTYGDESITFMNPSGNNTYGVIVDGFLGYNEGPYQLRVYAEGSTPPPFVPATQVPTLSEWGMITFFILLVGSALWVMKRRKREESV